MGGEYDEQTQAWESRQGEQRQSVLFIVGDIIGAEDFHVSNFAAHGNMRSFETV